MPYLVISLGQRMGQAGCGQRGRAGDANRRLARQCATKHKAYQVRKGPIDVDPTRWETNHYYPAAKPLWRAPIYSVRCQVELGLAIREAEKK